MCTTVGTYNGVDVYPCVDAIQRLVDAGWTAENAAQHLAGTCDRAVCCGH